MKNIMLTMAFVLVSTIIFAQHHKGDRMSGEKQALEMKEKLSLTDEQFAKLKSINEKFGERYTALRKDSTLSREQSFSEMKKIRQEKQDEIKSILTEQQFTQWTALKKEHRAKNRHGKRISGEEMKKALSLSDDQYAKVKAIDKKYGEQFKSLRKDSTLSQVTARAEMKKLKDERQGELKGVMSEEQYAKWKVMKAEQKKRKHEKRTK